MNPILLEKPRPAGAAPGPAAPGFAGGLSRLADYTAILDAIAGIAGPSAAEACLEDPFRPTLKDQVSFLVNGFWLIGRHRILEWEARDGRLAEDLRRIGHAVTSAERTPEGKEETGLAVGQDSPPGGFDRIMFLSRALGYAGGGQPSAWLKAMHRTLRPGGLLLFHVLDRDRAWDLVRDFTSREGAAGIAFDPRSGEVTVRIRAAASGAAGARQTVRAFNLAEIQALLAEAGFVLERAYGGWNGGSLEEEGAITGRMLVVASKPRRKARVRGAFWSEGRGLPGKRARMGSNKGLEKGSAEGGGG